MARATTRTACIDESNSDAVPHGTVRETVATFPARDGYPLTGTWYETGDPAPEVVVFNAGGGVSSARYRHFLRYLAAHGVPALAYDYRGVGRSAPARRRGFDAPPADGTLPASLSLLTGGGNDEWALRRSQRKLGFYVPIICVVQQIR